MSHWCTYITIATLALYAYLSTYLVITKKKKHIKEAGELRGVTISKTGWFI